LGGKGLGKMKDVSVTETNIPLEDNFANIVQQAKERRGIITAGFAGDKQYLQRVRDFEKNQAELTQQINLSMARGEDLDKLALLDPITELCNHRTFIKELKAEINRAKRYGHSIALCLMSIDHFDELAKQYGALTAEAILKIVGNVIQHSIREIDICGRYDAHQFIIALSKSGVSGGAIVSERIRQRIAAQGITHNWQSFSLTASFGVGAYPKQASEYDELIACAYEAMERGTNRGGDRVLAI
jgi:diguanylate cyclase (GGDEF)-like protein